MEIILPTPRKQSAASVVFFVDFFPTKLKESIKLNQTLRFLGEVHQCPLHHERQIHRHHLVLSMSFQQPLISFRMSSLLI